MLSRNRFLWIGLTSLTVIGVIAAVFFWNRDQGNEPDEPESQTGSTVRKKEGPRDDPQSPRKVPTGICRVYTPQPGFFVFVNGEPARNAKDEWLTTPCAVTVPLGAHEITVAKSGSRDTSRFVNVSSDTQVVFGKIANADGEANSILDAAYIRSETATPIPLLSLNTGGKKLDPYISPDGRSLYFVSDRGGIKGVYHVARETAYHYFTDKPKLIESTRGYDLPASPTITPDSLAVVYTVPKTGQILCVSRSTAVADFSKKRRLRTRSNTTAVWSAVQAVRDGDRAWRLYWLARDRGKFLGFVSTANRQKEQEAVFASNHGNRKTVLAPLAEQEFPRRKPFDLRGNPPCMSSDGLRQYVFDGKTLKRSTRSRADEPFSRLETIAALTLPSYRPAADRRSYSVTDDEQWLVYESGGDLYLIRIFEGRGWGFVFRGRSIPSLAPKIVKRPAPKPKIAPVPKKPTIDPRTLPLPYPLFRQKLVDLLKARKYAEARKLVESAMADPKLETDRNLIAWDKRNVERTAAFWDDFETAVAKMKRGDKFSIGPARLVFVEFKNGKIIADSVRNRITKKPEEMRPGDLIAIVDKKLGRKNESVQLHIAHFRYFDGKGSRNAGLSRMKRAGKEGAEFAARLATRDVQQAGHEFDRGNLAPALVLAQRVLRDYPKSAAATKAKSMIDRAYSLVKWNPVGRRRWQIGNGSYTAIQGVSPGSLLRSPEKFGNFELRLEWRSDVQNGQGGVYFRYAGSGDLSERAFKIQLSDDFGGRVDPLCTGALFKIEAPTENAARKRGEWNTLKLRVVGEKVRLIINGRRVLETTAKLPDTTAKTDKIPLIGYVALDGGLGGITYRRTLLLALPNSP